MNNWKRTFAVIWTGQFFSALSSSVVSYAVIFWLSLQTGSATVLSYAMLASMLPQLVLGLFSGVFIDRWSRKATMIIADSFIAICTAVLCILFYFGKIEVWQIYILLILRSVGSAFHTPAMQASVPLLAPESELMRISGINHMIHSISSIAGPALAALLINLLDMTVVFLFDVLGAAIACTTLLFVTIPNPPKTEEKERHLLREIKEGIMAIFSNRGLSWLFSFEVIVMFFIVPASALFPLFTTKHFLGGAYEMSIVETAWGLGMLAGGAMIGVKLFKNLNRSLLIAIACVIIGATFLFSGLLSPASFWWFAVLTGIGGIAVAFWSSAFTVLLQTNIDPQVLGRAFSIYDSLTLAPSVFGLLAAGFVAEAIGIAHVFIWSGAIICVAGMVVVTIPSVIKLGRIKR